MSQESKFKEGVEILKWLIMIILFCVFTIAGWVNACSSGVSKYSNPDYDPSTHSKIR